MQIMIFFFSQQLFYEAVVHESIYKSTDQNCYLIKSNLSFPLKLEVDICISTL